MDECARGHSVAADAVVAPPRALRRDVEARDSRRPVIPLALRPIRRVQEREKAAEKAFFNAADEKLLKVRRAGAVAAARRCTVAHAP